MQVVLVRLPDEVGNDQHLKASLQPMQHQEDGAEDRVHPQDQGLPEQEVNGKEATDCCERQAGSQGHFGLRQVPFCAWRRE